MQKRNGYGIIKPETAESLISPFVILPLRVLQYLQRFFLCLSLSEENSFKKDVWKTNHKKIIAPNYDKIKYCVRKDYVSPLVALRFAWLRSARVVASCLASVSVALRAKISPRFRSDFSPAAVGGGKKSRKI